MASLNQTIRDIERKHGAKIARAFSDAIADLRKSVVIGRVVEALERGDIETAVRALNIDQSAFAQLRAAITDAYSAAGYAFISDGIARPPIATSAVVRWDVSNPIAERSLREWLGTDITRITMDTRQAARSALADGYAKGQGPRQIALDVAGRIGPNGRRSGGVMGLNGPQEQWVRNMRTYLREGDLGRVLNMTVRDKRFDKTIRKMITDGTTPSAEQIDKWTARYSDRLLKSRGDMIARTETAASVEHARFDAFRVELEENNIPDRYVIKKWRHGGGGKKPRRDHDELDGHSVQGLNTPFVMGDGSLMQFPHDPNGSAKQIVNCTCSGIFRVDWIQARKDGVL